MRKPIIVGNWKMNKTCAEAVSFINEIEPKLHDGADYGIAAPFTALKDCVNTAKNLLVAAENCHFDDIGVKWCIIGHSERRQMFNETDETVNKKAKRLLEAGITPILCIGETEAQFDAGQTEEVIRAQLKGGLDGLCPKCVAKMVLAYEPIWAIGTGKSATKEIAQNCCHIVRDQVRVMFGDEAADSVRVQYGGSVKPNNIKEYMAMEDIDGALIGGASLKTDSFEEIINATK